MNKNDRPASSIVTGLTKGVIAKKVRDGIENTVNAFVAITYVTSDIVIGSTGAFAYMTVEARSNTQLASYADSDYENNIEQVFEAFLNTGVNVKFSLGLCFLTLFFFFYLFIFFFFGVKDR